jgi:hypothetical protein
MFQMTQQGNNIFQFRSIYKYIFCTDPREITPNIASTPHDITHMVRYSHSIPTWNILSIHNFQKYSPLANLNHTKRKWTIFNFSLLNGYPTSLITTLTKWSITRTMDYRENAMPWFIQQAETRSQHGTFTCLQSYTYYFTKTNQLAMANKTVPVCQLRVVHQCKTKPVSL